MIKKLLDKIKYNVLNKKKTYCEFLDNNFADVIFMQCLIFKFNSKQYTLDEINNLLKLTQHTDANPLWTIMSVKFANLRVPDKLLKNLAFDESCSLNWKIHEWTSYFVTMWAYHYILGTSNCYTDYMNYVAKFSDDVMLHAAATLILSNEKIKHKKRNIIYMFTHLIYVMTSYGLCEFPEKYKIQSFKWHNWLTQWYNILTNLTLSGIKTEIEILSEVMACLLILSPFYQLPITFTSVISNYIENLGFYDKTFHHPRVNKYFEAFHVHITRVHTLILFNKYVKNVKNKYERYKRYKRYKEKKYITSCAEKFTPITANVVQ